MGVISWAKLLSGWRGGRLKPPRIFKITIEFSDYPPPQFNPKSKLCTLRLQCKIKLTELQIHNMCKTANVLSLYVRYTYTVSLCYVYVQYLYSYCRCKILYKQDTETLSVYQRRRDSELMLFWNYALRCFIFGKDALFEKLCKFKSRVKFEQSRHDRNSQIVSCI